MVEQCQLLKSLRFCKGITSNSMLSMILPSYSHLEAAVAELKAMHSLTKCQWDSLCAYGDFSSEKSTKDPINSEGKGRYGNAVFDDDLERADYHYACKAFNETAILLTNLKYQDEDKDLIGLIVYYGYIEDPSNGEGLYAGKKAFHTFPIPKDNEPTKDVYIKLGTRFDLGLLNRNPWFTEEFGTLL